MVLIDGVAIANKILCDIKHKLKNKKLAVLLATNDDSAHHYVELKKQKAMEFDINVEVKKLNENTTTQDCINIINEWNENKNIDGILVQLPLYKHLNKYKILNSVIENKDVDGLSATMQGRVSQLDPNSVPPATVEGILEAINFASSENLTWDAITSNSFDPNNNFLNSKNITIINNSNLIGLPLAMILSKCNASVSILNKFSDNINERIVESDIVVTATGQTQIIDSKLFKNNSIIIDVTSKKINGAIFGDVIYDSSITKKNIYITPVPGGVGPLTIACLLRNLSKQLK